MSILDTPDQQVETTETTSPAVRHTKSNDRLPANMGEARDLHYDAIVRRSREARDLEYATELLKRFTKRIKAVMESANGSVQSFIRNDPIQIPLPGFEVSFGVLGAGQLPVDLVIHDKDMAETLSQNNVQTVAKLGILLEIQDAEETLEKFHFDEHEIAEIQDSWQIASRLISLT